MDPSPTLFGVGIAFSIISTAAVLLRFQSRKIKHVKLGPDDWSILIALVIHLLGLLKTKH